MAGSSLIATPGRLLARVLLLSVVLSLIAAVLPLGPTPVARAAGITVTTLNDVVDSGDRFCSLREAITSANTNTASGVPIGECIAGDLARPDTIGFSVSGTITLNGTQLPTITSAMTINTGGGITVDGDLLSRILEIDGAPVTLRNFTMTRGAATGSGGAILIKGGANVRIELSAIMLSSATDQGGGVGVMGGASVSFDNSAIINNTGLTGGIAVLDSTSSATLVETVVAGNTGTGPAGAGGIYVIGELTIDRSSIEDNTSTGSGGAGAIKASPFNGAITMTDSAVTSNEALGAGHGFIIGGGPSLTLSGVTVAENSGSANNAASSAVQASQTATIVNSTISGNDVTNAILLGGSGTFTLTYSTVTDNGRGLFIIGDPTVTIGGSIVFANNGIDISVFETYSGAFTSEGSNVIGGVDDNTPDQLVRFDAINDLQTTGIASGLLPLANNGGPTETHLLANGSPAIDRVTRPVSNEPVVDQRGVARPTGAANDAGATENVGVYPRCLLLLPTIIMANGDSGIGTPGDDVILGTAGPDNINGGGGNDSICGGDGDDDIRGGAGNDVILGEGGDDVVRGGGGNDNIAGGFDNDELLGQGGSDQLYGDEGDDTLDGLGAPDQLFGGQGNDTLSGQNGSDLLLGQAGDDVVRGNKGPDALFGEDGDDDLFGGDGADDFWGGDGIDKCAGNTGPDRAEAASCESTPGVEVLF